MNKDANLETINQYALKEMARRAIASISGDECRRIARRAATLGFSFEEWRNECVTPEMRHTLHKVAVLYRVDPIELLRAMFHAVLESGCD